MSSGGKQRRVKWIVPPRAAPTVKKCRCGGVMMCSRFPGNTTDDLFRIPCALSPARLLCSDVPSVRNHDLFSNLTMTPSAPSRDSLTENTGGTLC